MTSPNKYVSNGTCYTAPGQKLDDSFIPCGNDAFGYQTCCGAGDNCLADNACFGLHGTGYGSYMTYLAGCTDSNYTDATCPKKVIVQPWVALTLCDNSNGVWAICSQKGNPSTLQRGSYCSCTAASSATLAFSASSSLAEICSLPLTIGQSIEFVGGHAPSSVLASRLNTPSASLGSATPSATHSSSSTPSSSSTSSGPTSTKAVSTVSGSDPISAFPSSSQTVPSSVAIAASATSSAAAAGGDNSSSTLASGNTGTELSIGASIGVGVGAGIGGLVLGLIPISFLVRRKRRRRAQQEKESGDGENGTTSSKPDAPDEKSIDALFRAPTVRDANGQIVPEADVRPAQPWPLRSELVGSPVMRDAESVPVAELPGSEMFAGEQGDANTLAIGTSR